MRINQQAYSRLAHYISFIALIAFILPLTACATSNWPTPKPNPITDSQTSAHERPLIVIYVPGISGIWFTDRNWALGLQDAGIDDIRKFEWTGPIALINLIDDDLHRRKAEVLTDMIRESWSESDPHPRIVITAHSGGARVALLAIESLAADADNQPEQESSSITRAPIVEQLWLIAPALDPNYDLTPALDYLARLVTIQSSSDSFILGLGTSVFGTADNYYGNAAGKVGFSTEDPRLEVWQYEKSWRANGATSGHLGALSQEFARKIVGPSILNWNPNRDNKK